MPKINVYLSDDLADAVRDAQLPVSAICQTALERAVRDVSSLRATDRPPATDQAALGFFARFTPRARQAVSPLAEEAARAVPHDYVGTEHILLGVITEGHNLALNVLESLGVETDDLRSELVASMPEATSAAPGHTPYTRLAKSAIDLTAKEALALGHNYIGCEHLLLGLLGTEDGIASEVLRRMGLELRTTRRAVVAQLSGFVRDQQKQSAASTSSPTPIETALEQIMRRLEAIEQRLEPSR
jgi:ATP-dependent Clp protease ATP-binding subunit ClpA